MAILDTKANFVDMSVVNATAPVQVTEFPTFSISFSWQGLDASDATAEVQGSVDGLSWNRIKSDDNVLILDTTEDTQIWEILDVTTRYVRLFYSPGTVTTGSATVEFFGGVQGA